MHFIIYMANVSFVLQTWRQQTCNLDETEQIEQLRAALIEIGRHDLLQYLVG